MEAHFDIIAAKVTEAVITYGPKLILAILTLIIGSKLIHSLKKFIEKTIIQSNIDNSLKPYISGISVTLAKVVLYISVAGMIGIQTTSFIAILGAAGLAIGMALQGSLANFAGGVLILLFKYFKVGDYIKAQGQAGTVKEIQVFATILNTPDNRIIIIPNGPLAGGTIENVSALDTRRVDLVFGIGYDDNIDTAKEVFKRVLSETPEILPEPTPTIEVNELADSSVNFIVRPWVMSKDYWKVYYSLTERMKKALDEAGLSIPYPQRDIHVYNTQK